MGSTSSRRGGNQAAPTRAWRRAPLLLLTAAIVVSTGTVVASITESAPPPSTTEQARLDALAGLEGLASAFEEHDDGGASPTADLLRTQADLLRLTTSWPSGSPAEPGTAAPSSPAAVAGRSPQAVQPPGPGELAGLAGDLLADARETDPGLARLLASIGSAVFAQAQALAGEAEVAAPWGAPEKPPAAPGCADPSAPAGDGHRSQTPGGPTTAEALAAVVRSHERLAYAYETVLPRLAGAERGTAAERLVAHADAAGNWRAVAAAECLALPLPEPAYALGSDFAADPLPALQGAEKAALRPLADLVSLSSGTVREHAVSGLATATAELAASTGVVPPAPGLDDELLAAPATD